MLNLFIMEVNLFMENFGSTNKELGFSKCFLLWKQVEDMCAFGKVNIKFGNRGYFPVVTTNKENEKFLEKPIDELIKLCN